MPGQHIHEQIDILLFGEAYPEVHKHKDEPWAWLGPYHRLLRHDPLYSLTSPNPLSSMAHDLADFITLPMAPIVSIIAPELMRE